MCTKTTMSQSISHCPCFCWKTFFNELQLNEIISIAPKTNTPSIHVMKKLGMEYVQEFDHPKLIDFPELKSCVLYKKSNSIM